MPKVVVCVPTGRRRYLECLLPHLLQACNEHAVDRINLWMHVLDDETTPWVEEMCARYPDKLFMLNLPKDGIGTEHMRYYHTCTEPDTIYVKIDDDIVWMGSGAIKRLAQFRIDNPAPLLVIGNVVNNALCNYWHMVKGIYPHDMGITRSGLDSISIRSPELANLAHATLLYRIHANKLDDYNFGTKVMEEYEFSPIHVFAWRGSDFIDGAGKVVMSGPGISEEKWLTTARTREVGRYVAFYGGALFSHFAYVSQRENARMPESDMLTAYLAERPGGL